MKYKLTDQERADRVERRAARRQAVADHVQAMRDWRQARVEAAEKRRKAAKQAKPEPRGIDRVPGRLRDLAVRPAWHVEHHNTPRSMRRRGGVTWPADGNQPHVNADRDEKSLKAGRLRAELRLEAGDDQ